MSTPWLTKAILLFVFVQALSIAFSQNPGSSLVAFMLAQMSWTAVFFTAAFVFSFEHNVKRLPLLLCGIPLIQVLIAAIEFRLGHVPWAGHIPSFFKIEDPIVEAILAGGARNGVYRVQTTFSVSLGLSEYMALAFPFSIWWVFHARRIISRIAAVALVPLSIFVVAITQARVGFLGLVITATLYPLILGFSAWWKRKQSILSSAIVFFSPVGIAAAVSAVLIVPALRYRVIGGGQAQLSTQGRIDQINLGIPKILSHPWGYGAGQGAEVLGYHNLAGLLTIDSYWLRAVLEYGILGASIFLLLFVLAVYHSLRGALFVKNETSEATLFVPIGIGLLTFPIMQSAFAAEPNMPAAFLLLGCLSALVFRARQQDHDPQLRAQDRSRLSEINLHKPNWLGGFSS